MRRDGVARRVGKNANANDVPGSVVAQRVKTLFVEPVEEVAERLRSDQGARRRKPA